MRGLRLCGFIVIRFSFARSRSTRATAAVCLYGLVCLAWWSRTAIASSSLSSGAEKAVNRGCSARFRNDSTVLTARVIARMLVALAFVVSRSSKRSQRLREVRCAQHGFDCLGGFNGYIGCERNGDF